MDKIEISVVVPVYNASETLKSLTSEISDTLKNKSSIIFNELNDLYNSYIENYIAI